MCIDNKKHKLLLQNKYKWKRKKKIVTKEKNMGAKGHP